MTPLPRFFCEHVTVGRMPLPAEQSRHAVGSRRLHAGDPVVLFDGSGVQWPATIAEIRRRGREVILTVGPPEAVDLEPVVAVTVATALPKGHRWHWLLEKCTELGAAAIRPVDCRRSIVRPEHAREDAWRRVCIAAAKQCGRNRLPALAGPAALQTVLSEWEGDLILIADAAGEPVAALAAAVLRPQRVLLLIGPEGGFTDPEREAVLAAGGRPVRLGATTLRTETAAAALLAALLALWG